jgi:UDP:flavonoid glycosyltransferase YjiC (YdhE family)
MTGWWFEARRPSWLVAASYYAVDRLVVDRILTPAINHLRASLGLVAVDRPLHTWWFSPDGVAGLFPEWFGPTSAAWPKQFRALGFPLIDHSRAHTDTHGSTPSTEATLLDRPIVFTAGSGNLHAREFFRSAVAVCGQSNQPAVMLCREREQLPLTLPRRVIHLPYSPLSELLPRASAIVHHGGIGTTSQGFAAGLPQWVFPFAYDQFDNATRVRRLGVGDWTPSARVSTAAMQRAVTALQDRSDWRRTARGLADRLADQPDASAAAADWIVAMARERGIADPKPPATGSSSADER